MATSFSPWQHLLVEAVEKGLYDLTLPEDEMAMQLIGTFPASPMMGKTTDRANSSDEGAVGFEASYSILHTRGARATGSLFGGTDITRLGAYTDVSIGQAASSLYLDPAHTPMRDSYQVKAKLKAFKGQVAYNEDQVRAKMIAEPVADIMAGLAEDPIYKWRMLISNCFWGDGNGALVQFAAAGTIPASTSTPAAAGAIAFSRPGGPYSKIIKGERYIVVENRTSATKWTQVVGSGGSAATAYVRCVEVDVDNGTAWFQVEPGGVAIAITAPTSPTVGDFIVMEGMLTDNLTGATFAAQTRCCEGVESLIRNTGNFPGTGWDVTARNELKGFIRGDEASLSNPTPETIAELVDVITNAKIRPPSTWVSRQDVRTYYGQLERAGAATYYVPQGAQFQPSGGVDAPRFGHFAYAPAWLESNQCRTNTLFGIEPSSFRKYIPMGEGRVRWITPTGDSRDGGPVFSRRWSGRQATELLAADFEGYYQIGCTDPRRNFIYKGLRTQADIA
ncbi:MAG: hypothetical protein ACKV2Q_36495 [Planctomycetaceae bacterium]